MTDPTHKTNPDGVLVSSDAGTPSAVWSVGRLDGSKVRDRTAEPPNRRTDPSDPLQALEFDAVLEDIAARAAGPLGAGSVLARRPVTDLGWIREELSRVEELATLARGGKGVVAEPVPELDQPLARLRIAGSVLDGRELLAIRRTLAAGRLVLGELRRVAVDAPQVAGLQVSAPDKALERRLDRSLDDDGGVRDDASPALAAARSDVRTARERLVQKLEAMLRGVGGDGGVTLREGRYVIPIARDQRSRPEGIVHDESASGATLYVEPTAAIPLANAMREAEARSAREELKVLRDMTDLLRPAHAELSALHAMCVAVDDLVARARWVVDRDGYAPQVAAAPAELRILNGRHPLLLDGSAVRRIEGDDGNDGNDASPRTDRRDRRAAEPPNRQTAEPTAVPFDLTLDPGERTVLLSGPNTGGKSVLLKAVGLHVALAQSGIIPPVGPGSALPVFRRIFADIGDRQSIAASLSTFSAHLALLRVILDEADASSLVLLDEIGSGTDPAEGGALAAATLLALTRRGAVTLATTHLGVLKRLATEAAGIVNASLQFDAATLRPTYRLTKGIPGRSYGLAIARRLGLNEQVLADAEAQVPEAERSLDALLAAVEARARELAGREEGLRARLEQVDHQAAALAAQAEAQAARETTLRRQEREAERAGREQARRYLLEARETVEAAIARANAAGEEAARAARRMVEEAAAEARLEADRRTGGPADGIKVGSRVRLEGGTVADVEEIRSDGKAVLRIGSLKLVADSASLTPLSAQPSASPPVRQSASPPVRPSGSRAASEPPNRRTAEPSYEVDLRGLTGEEAEQAVVGALDRAVLAEQPFLRIIHGKGTGVVRERVQQVLRRDRRVKRHAFAPSNQGGTGVTVAEFAP